MSTSPTSFNNLAAESLAHIFALLTPEDRIRLERVCRQWRELVRKYGWIGFRTLTLNGQELIKEGDLALAKYRALLDRCAPHLRELSTAIVDCTFEQWARMRNLRHLSFQMCVSSCTLRAVAVNLKHLQSIHFANINWRSVAVLHDLLRVDNASLQALHLPLSNSRGDSLCLPALPSSLRLLQLGVLTSCDNFYLWGDERTCDRINELLELAASCCPQLAILMMPTANELSLAKLAKFEKLLYLRLYFNRSDANLLAFGNSLEIIGAQLRALFLGEVNSRILQLIAEHSPLLEHCSFRITNHYSRLVEAAGLLLSALHSLFQLSHLCSVSISCSSNSGLRAQILDAINGLNAKGTLEYLHISMGLPFTAEFVINLIQLNPKLRKLACKVRNNDTQELDKLKTLLQNMDRPMELELSGQIPPELEKSSRVRVRDSRSISGCISQPMWRKFLARAMDSVP